MGMEWRTLELFRRFSARARTGFAEWLLQRREIPRGVSRAAGFSAFLAVSALSFLGGVLLLATFMHVVVTKFDVPQNLPYPVYSVSSAGAAIASGPAATSGSLGAAGAAGTSGSPGGSGRNAPGGPAGTSGASGAARTGSPTRSARQAPATEPGSTASGRPRLIVIQRPTISRALDRWLSRRPDPAARYLQSDAVDLGLLLQREVHRVLLQILGDATRTPPPVERPVGVPLTNGQ